MFRTISYKTKQFLFVLIKLSIVIGSFYFIYIKLTDNPDLKLNTFINIVSKNNQITAISIFFLMALSILNWLLEILKWQVLVSCFKKTSFYKALEQCLGALTASLITPNRVGEYGVKAMYFSPINRKQILALNFLGNSLQMLVTILFGVLGLLLFVSTFPKYFNFNKTLLFALLFLVAILISMVIFLKSRITIGGFSTQKISAYFKQIPSFIYGLGFVLALTRYLLFSFQFYYILTLFGVSESYFGMMVIICSMYFLASVIPSLAIFDVLIKGSVAVYLFSFAGISTITVLCTVTLMWLLNVVLPSIFGSIFVLKFKLPKS